MSRFIGESRFYPKWTQDVGLWVHQKVPVQTGTMPLIFPPEASQHLVWVPPKRGAFVLKKISLQEEISNSINELAYLGQQLWPNFATFITEAQRLDRYKIV